MAGRFIAVNPTVASPRPFTLSDQGRLKTLFTSLNERCSRRLNSPIRRAPTVSACQFPLRWGGLARLVGMVVPSDAYQNFLSCAGEMRRVRIAAISRAHRKKTYSMSKSAADGHGRRGGCPCRIGAMSVGIRREAAYASESCVWCMICSLMREWANAFTRAVGYAAPVDAAGFMFLAQGNAQIWYNPPVYGVGEYSLCGSRGRPCHQWRLRHFRL